MISGSQLVEGVGYRVLRRGGKRFRYLTGVSKGDTLGFKFLSCVREEATAQNTA